jgi:hypothetical protein
MVTEGGIGAFESVSIPYSCREEALKPFGADFVGFVLLREG